MNQPLVDLPWWVFDHDLLLVKGKGIACMLDTNVFVEENIIISIRVTLGIDGFGSDFAIGKLNAITTSVKDGIVIGKPNDVSLSIALAADYYVSGKCATMW